MKEVQNEQLFQELDNEVAATCRGGSVYLYENDFLNGGNGKRGGRVLKFSKGTDDLRIYNFNDQTSSIYIDKNESWVFYQDINKGGHAVTLVGPISSYLDDLQRIGIQNDWISSLKRIK
ncbi:beta/gamma crystallin-related protein [Nostoc sp. DSM 114159]|jgi:hypothetical protein